MIIREATAMDVRNNLGDLLNGVEYRHDSVVISKAGKPVAALVDIELFQRIRLLKGVFKKLTAEMAEAFDDYNQNEIDDLVGKAVKAVRKKKRNN